MVLTRWTSVPKDNDFGAGNPRYPGTAGQGDGEGRRALEAGRGHEQDHVHGVCPLLQDRRRPGRLMRHSRGARGQTMALRLRPRDHEPRRSDRKETSLALSAWVKDLQHCDDWL